MLIRSRDLELESTMNHYMDMCPGYDEHLGLIPSNLLTLINDHFIPIDHNWIDVERLRG
jgi:hypothetical protein